jgi:hypothetical protein
MVAAKCFILLKPGLFVDLINEKRSKEWRGNLVEREHIGQ